MKILTVALALGAIFVTNEASAAASVVDLPCPEQSPARGTPPTASFLSTVHPAVREAVRKLVELRLENNSWASYGDEVTLSTLPAELLALRDLIKDEELQGFLVNVLVAKAMIWAFKEAGRNFIFEVTDDAGYVFKFEPCEIFFEEALKTLVTGKLRFSYGEDCTKLHSHVLLQLGLSLCLQMERELSCRD